MQHHSVSRRILVAIGMFRGSGAMDLLMAGLRPLVSTTGFPAATVSAGDPRSLTGSGSLALHDRLSRPTVPTRCSRAWRRRCTDRRRRRSMCSLFTAGGWRSSHASCCAAALVGDWSLRSRPSLSAPGSSETGRSELLSNQLSAISFRLYRFPSYQFSAISFLDSQE